MLSSDSEQRRTIALLQEKALRLESEVADRKNAERDRAMLAAIIESSEDAIISKSLDGIIRTWNSAAERLFGYTEREVVGKPITIIIPPERIDEEKAILRRLRRGERIEHYETVRVAKDGRRIEISLTVSPLRDSEGNLIGASKIARDITAQKHAEAERIQLLAAERAARAEADAAQRRFRELVDGLEAVVWEADARTWQFTFINQRAEEILGYPVEQWLEEPGFWAQVIHPDDRDHAMNLCRSAIAECRDHDFEYRAVAADGRVVWLRDIVYVVRGDDGRAQHLRGLMIDVTAMKQTEAALKDADRRKDEFLATLAHELRNPLAPISNGLQILKLASGTGASSEETAEIHRMIERQVGHMVRLIDDLLEFSRISRGKINLKREQVAVDAFIEHALEASKPLIEEGRHRLEVRLPQQPLVVHGDPIRLAQIVSNLLNNAAKYTDAGGTITLTADRQGNETVLSVRDTGIGIERDMLSKVFDLFAQVENPRRGGQEGLGIGLSLVRALVETHGGSVEARSAGLGCGSEFVVRLPLSLEHASAGERKPGSPDRVAPGAAEQRVLIVDDNRDAADSLARVLKLQGCIVRAVYDGPSALEAIAADRPEFVLLDLGMPHMDGYEVARRIRQDDRNKQIQLIALTGWGQEEHRRRSREAGFDRHLVKPVAVNDVRTLLQKEEPA